MKNLLNILFIAGIFFLASCEGPRGYPGEDGEDAFIGTTFEFTGTFTANNGYELLFNFEDNGFLPYESDVALTYILWENADGLDFWRPLPQTTYFDSGAILQYNFDFTADIPNNVLVDLAVFLEGDIDLSTLSPDYTHDQTFRIVVVPSDFLALKSVDANDINSILDAPNLQLNTTERVELKQLPELKVD